MVETDPIDLDPVPESLAESVSFLLNRSTRIMREMNERALAPLKLTARELSMMRLLAGDGPISQQTLGKKHNVDRTTIVQLVDGLENRGLLNRVPDKKDRRVNLLYITSKGKKVLAQGIKIADQQQKIFLGPLQAEEWTELRTILIKLIKEHFGK